MSNPARFVRQVMLSEIGVAGQAAIEASDAAVGGPGLAHEVASLYAQAAGFASVSEGPIDVAMLAPQTIVTQEAPREVLAGARAALAAMRAALVVASER